MGTLSDIVEQFDKDNDVPLPSGAHSAPSVKKDRDIILKELLNTAVFSCGSSRHHASFPRVKVWLKFDREALLTWMIDRMS